MKKADFSKEVLQQLYGSGKSITDIALLQKCSIHKVVYWMNKYNIKRRTWSEAVYLKSNPNGDPFKIKDKLNQQESILFGLGLGIYWGEGEKVSKGKVRVANSDINLILSFRDFLISICQVTITRIHYSIICFNDSNPLEVSKYWSKMLEIPEEKFGKIVQIAPQGKGNYRRKSKYGVCIIEVSNTKLKAWIMKELDKLHILPT